MKHVSPQNLKEPENYMSSGCIHQNETRGISYKELKELNQTSVH